MRCGVVRCGAVFACIASSSSSHAHHTRAWLLSSSVTIWYRVTVSVRSHNAVGFVMSLATRWCWVRLHL